jgi:antitoxin HicB
MSKWMAIIDHTGNNWTASIAGLRVSATHLELAGLKKLLSEGVALHLRNLQECGIALPEPVSAVPDDIELDGNETFDWIEPAPMNPVSLAVRTLVKGSGLSMREFGKRTGINYAMLSRLCNPFYWGHNVATLQSLADATKATLHVMFEHPQPPVLHLEAAD